MSGLFFQSCSQIVEPSSFELIEADRPIIEAYAAENGLDGLFNFEGVYVVTETEGDTATSFPNSSSRVDLLYQGSLLSGEVFNSTATDSLRTSEGEWPRLNELISGVESGLKLFRKGGRGTLIIPSALAYEEHGSTDGKVPPYAILRFDFELVDFE
ncbi:MAG: FKBP-type peptidyl-prolyl cis-trans isomerase [Bacteroidota bacterium]